MLLGMMQSRTSIMPRSLTTPGGVRFLDPANYVTQEELDRRDRRWRAMRERAWARAAAQACLSGVGVNVGRSSGSAAASIASGWADDTATLVGSVRYYAAASSAVRDWGDRNSVGSASRRRRQRQQQQIEQQAQAPAPLQRSQTTSGGSVIGRTSSDGASFFSVPSSEGQLAETQSLRRRPTQSSVAESSSNASNLLEDADPFSDTAGNVFRGTLAGMTAGTGSRSRSGTLMQPQARSASTAQLSRYSSHHAHRHMQSGPTRTRTQSQPFASATAGSGAASIRAPSSHGHEGAQRGGGARLLALRNQMRRRKISEALQRLLGGVRV